MLAQGQLPGGRVQPPVLAADESAYLLHQLAIATGRDLTLMRADCKKVAGIMRDAMSEINQRQSPNRASV